MGNLVNKIICRKMSKAEYLPILIALVLLTASVVRAETVTWNVAGGSWYDANKWTPANVPMPADDAVINGTGTVTVNSDVTISSLTIGGSAAGNTLTLNSGVFSMSSEGFCKPAPNGSLPVTLHPQETINWCWAASAQMVMDYLGHNVSQCAEANTLFNRTDCCNIDLCPAAMESPQYDAFGNCINCVCGGWPQFGKYGFTFKTTSGAPLTWDQLREQISDGAYCKKKPFAFSWSWPGGGGHMMVAKGYQTTDGINYVVILDPLGPCIGDERIITYDFYNADPTDHSHWNDYYDVTYTGVK